MSKEFWKEAMAEHERAVKKYPEPNPNLAALMEEVGEVARALLDNQSDAALRAECVQVAAMACRIATRGDAQFPRGDGCRMDDAKGGES